MATADEAAALRAAGIGGAAARAWARCRAEELAVALGRRADVVAWRERFVGARCRRAARGVHVKLDTGMGRLGTRDPDEATRVAPASPPRRGRGWPALMTHFATADDDGDAFFDEQLARFAPGSAPLRERHPERSCTRPTRPRRCASPAAHFDMVRCGIAIYGMDPFQPRPGRAAASSRRSS